MIIKGLNQYKNGVKTTEGACLGLDEMEVLIMGIGGSIFIAAALITF